MFIIIFFIIFILSFLESIKFIENLKGFIDNEDRIVLGDGFTERNILISHILENNAYNNKIKIGSCRWYVK